MTDSEGVDGWGRSRGATVAAWVAFALVAVVVAHSIRGYDFRDRPVFGDQASFILQAQSLAHDDHNLSYDAADFERFRDLGWADQPLGLFFQRNDHGWAFAKPYGYSVWLVPFIRVLGPGRGVAAANLVLLGIVGLLGALALRLRFRGAVVPIVLGAFLFGSYLFFYGYHLYTELFLAALVGGAFLALVKGTLGRNPVLVGAGLVVAAFLVVEKPPALVLVAPAVLVALRRIGSWRTRCALAGVAAVVALVAVVPYLHYSDFATWNPYGGERYYAATGVPFGGSGGYWRYHSDETFSLGYVTDNAFGDLPDKARSALYYVAGRHTGVAVFMPLAVFLVGVAALGWRRSDDLGRSVLAGLAAYVVFYVWFFPFNYYGGGQSFGNRYFLQASPVVLFLPALFRMRARTLAVGSAACVVVAVVLLGPHYRDPSGALLELHRTSPAQRLLPFEVNQTRANFFKRDG